MSAPADDTHAAHEAHAAHRATPDLVRAEVCGICAGDVPPLIGHTLTGSGLTLDQAARRLIEDGVLPGGLTDVQQRLVTQHAEHLAAAG